MTHQTKFGKFKKTANKSNKDYTPIRIILVILLITNLVSFMVWQNIKGLDINNKLNKLETERLELHHQLQENLIEYEMLRKSESIENIAKQKLKMVPTDKDSFITLGIRDQGRLLNKFQSTKTNLDNKEWQKH